MYIKNQKFSDEDMLLEMLFDFSLGTRTAYVSGMVATIDKELAESEQYQELLKTMPDADDRAEVYEEERDMRLADVLLGQFNSFEVKDSCLYGVNEEQSTLLFEIDLY
jgi:hypothetical protein